MQRAGQMMGEGVAVCEHACLPLVSIIVCTYNYGGFIVETLRSLLAQTYTRKEIVVVDDGSTDNTSELVQSMFPQVRYIYQTNTGSSAARNAGINASTGELIGFFDADDLMPPDCLSSQVDFLLRHPNVGLVVCDYQNFKGEEKAADTHFQTCPYLQEHIRDQSEFVLEDARMIMAREHFGITGTLLFRRSLLEQVPGFDPQLRGCEDFHFYFRLARHTPVGIVNRVGMLRRLHESNISSDWALMIPNGIRSYSWLRDTEEDSRVRNLLNEKIASRWEAWARHDANRGNLLRALHHYSRAFFTNPGWDVLLRGLYGSSRALAIGVGLHKSDEKS